jgi:hypothetical protein
MNLDNIGVSTVKDSTAFKKIQFFSKTNPTNLFNIKSDFQNSFTNLSSHYLSDLDLNQSYTYGMDRQHNYTSLNSSLPMHATLLDNSSLNKFFSYNLGTSVSYNGGSVLSTNRLSYDNSASNAPTSKDMASNLNNLVTHASNTKNAFNFSFFMKVPNTLSVLGAENDSKQYSNPLKYGLNLLHKKKTLSNLGYVASNFTGTEPTVHVYNPNNSFASSTFNTENTLKFKDYKSSNAQFLGSERTVRLLSNLNTNNYK